MRLAPALAHFVFPLALIFPPKTSPDYFCSSGIVKFLVAFPEIPLVNISLFRGAMPSSPTPPDPTWPVVRYQFPWIPSEMCLSPLEHLYPISSSRLSGSVIGTDVKEILPSGFSSSHVSRLPDTHRCRSMRTRHKITALQRSPTLHSSSPPGERCKLHLALRPLTVSLLGPVTPRPGWALQLSSTDPVCQAICCCFFLWISLLS